MEFERPRVGRAERGLVVPVPVVLSKGRIDVARLAFGPLQCGLGRGRAGGRMWRWQASGLGPQTSGFLLQFQGVMQALATRLRAMRHGRTPVIGVFGGSFNPPHLGHAMVPSLVRARGLADHILVAPCADHPLGKPMRSFSTRLALVGAAMEPHGDFVTVTDLEQRLADAHGGPSYTIRLLDHLASELPDAQVRLLVGSDIVCGGETARWRDWDRIERVYSPIVVPRAGYSPAEDCALPQISSTRVRELADAGQWGQLSSAVPAAVLELLRAPVRPPVVLVGQGHVAAHVVPWLRRQGRDVVVWGGHAVRARDVDPVPEAPAGIWLLVRDGVLPEVAQAIVEQQLAPTETPMLHAAGALVAQTALAAAARRGHPVGTLHPICSLRSEQPWPSWLGRAAFGLEGDPRARAWALELVGEQRWLDLQGLDARGRIAYHAGCALVANHFAVLLESAASVLASQGQPRADVYEALGTLMDSSLANLRALGIPGGITGPISRGNPQAVRRHLEALSSADAELYATLSQRLESIVDAAAIPTKT